MALFVVLPLRLETAIFADFFANLSLLLSAFRSSVIFYLLMWQLLLLRPLTRRIRSLVLLFLNRPLSTCCGTVSVHEDVISTLRVNGASDRETFVNVFDSESTERRTSVSI